MKIKRIAHIGLAVADTGEARSFFSDILGLAMKSEEMVGELKVAFLPIGETNLELCQSTTPDGVIAKHVAKRGEGVQHVAFEVEDIDAALAELKAKGVRLIDQEPRPGAHNARIAFIHPKETHGVLTELCEYPKDH
ncbi:MAG: methylmalonyl-CoA epimerase [Thermodesulfobacteriota bacterium]|nr:methylmalonyl-CoA epimerase [Thermodesulfobacteriota bacterium]